MKKELQRYSLRKSSLGAASVLLGTAIIAVGASNASADEVATAPVSSTLAVKATDTVEESTSTVADSTDKKVVNVTEEGNTTVKTSEVTNKSLETAKTAATNEGIEVKEEPAQTKDTVEAATADNKAQAEKINSVVSDYKAAKEQYKSDKAAYNKAKINYDAKVAEKEVADKQNALSAAKYQAELATYNQAKADYEAALAQYNSDKAKYAKESLDYQSKLKVYQTALKQYQEAKAAYDKYMEDPVYRNLKDAVVAQELTFHRETEATHKLEGVSNYLTKATQERLNTSNVFQYDSNKLQASDIVTDSPWTNTEDEWIQVKEGDKFVVTYDGLNQSSMLVKNETSPIKRVVYRYEIVSLPSNDGKGIAKISKDPTVTMTVGASTDQAKPVKVAVDIEFYDKDGKMFNLSEHNAVVALNSLNHWNGAAYVEPSERPRPITVEAKDVNGNTVRGTYNPYADGTTLAIQNGEVVTKSGYADFGNGVTVNISDDNPLKVLVPIIDWNGSEWFVSREIPSDVTTLNASGAGNGHALGNEDYTFGDKDDVIGTYSVSTETGLIIFTPKKKYQSTRHQEYVNIGDNQFIAIPKSSVTYDAATKEVTSVNDNQYIDHGSVYNGETTSHLTGWDNEDSPYLYYGGAGIKMTNGHLVFTADGANADGAPTVYWFAINSSLGLPKNPGEKPEEPKAPTPPTPPTEPVAPTPPTPKVVEVPAKPVEPKTPEKPTVVWHKNYVVERESHVVPPTPKTPEKPVTPPTTPTPKAELPQTGEHTSIAGVLGFIPMTIAAFVGFSKRRKED